MKLTRSEKAYRAVCIAMCTFTALISLYPLLYTLFMSFASSQELAAKGGYMAWFPSKPTTLAYRKILNGSTFVLPSIKITAIRTVVGSLLHLLVCSLTGYALSRKELPGRKQYITFMLITILFSGGLIPGYVAISSMGLLNSFWVMVIPGMFSAFDVLIFKQFFEDIPQEMEEAAIVDGVTELQLFFMIIFPLSKPVMASIGLFTVVGHWNSWFDAFLYINQQHSYLWPLQTYVMIVFNNLNNLNNPELTKLMQEASATGAGVTDMSTKMALTIVAILPVLCIYPFFQKYFNRGVYLGAVKG